MTERAIHPFNARRRFRRHAFEVLQDGPGGTEILVATFTVTARGGKAYAREQAENRCRAALAADPERPARFREINAPVRISCATPLRSAASRGI